MASLMTFEVGGSAIIRACQDPRSGHVKILVFFLVSYGRRNDPGSQCLERREALWSLALLSERDFPVSSRPNGVGDLALMEEEAPVRPIAYYDDSHGFGEVVLN